MPIFFKSFKSDNYFISKWLGDFTCGDAVNSYKHFCESNEWVPGMNELADIGEFDFESFTTPDLMQLANYVESVCRKYNIENIKTAVYCPKLIQVGMANAYSAWADESPETIQIFSDMDEAKNWLLKEY